MKRCYLIRHAQTLWNRDNRLQGHSDLPLSPLGLEQSRRLASWFSTHAPLQGIFTSHLRRSQETARAIAAAQYPPQSPVVEPFLAEMHLGDWEGLTPEEVDARFEGAYQQWLVRPSSVRISGAEPLESFRERARSALEKILTSFEEGTCVVVSHGGIIASLLADILEADYDRVLRRLRLENTGITAIECCGDRAPYLLWINSTTHLNESTPLSLESTAQSPSFLLK